MMSTGTYIGEIVKRFLYICLFCLSFYFIYLNLILFFFILIISILLIFSSSFTIVKYENGVIEIIQNRILGFSNRITIFNLSDIKSITYHNFGLDLPNRTYNMLGPTGSRIPIKRDFLEIVFKTGEEKRIGVNLEGAKLIKIINKINSTK